MYVGVMGSRCSVKKGAVCAVQAEEKMMKSMSLSHSLFPSAERVAGKRGVGVPVGRPGQWAPVA